MEISIAFHVPGVNFFANSRTSHIGISIIAARWLMKESLTTTMYQIDLWVLFDVFFGVFIFCKVLLGRLLRRPRKMLQWSTVIYKMILRDLPIMKIHLLIKSA